MKTNPEEDEASGLLIVDADFMSLNGARGTKRIVGIAGEGGKKKQEWVCSLPKKERELES